jgi:hypothetical protein
MKVTLTTHSVIFGSTRYAVMVDGQTFCHTEDDEDGLKLGIAIARLELQRKMKNDSSNA